MDMSAKVKGRDSEEGVGLLSNADGNGMKFEDHYRPSPNYEGYHRYDPDFKWRPQEEQQLVRKLDWKICLWVCIMFFALQLDRGNISQANSDDMLDDLGLTTNDFNTGQTIFFLGFIFAELPSQVVSKWVGPDKWIPIQMISWSSVAALQAFMSGRKSFFLCRALLGIWEGGYIPSTVLYLSYFYTSKELPVRLSYFWTSFSFTFIASSFLAYAILHLRGVGGVEGWRWLFGIEGSATCLIGILSYFYLPASPTQTASRLSGGKPWFTEDEEKIMVNRVLRDDPTKGDMHNREALTMKMLWTCLCDFDMWPTYLIGLTWLVPPFPIGQYLTLLLRGDHFDTFTTNLLTIPTTCIFICNLLFWTRISEKINERFLLSCVSQLWCLPLIFLLEVLPGDSSAWTRYVICTLIGGFPFMHAVLVATTSSNSGSVRTRTVSAAIYNMACQMGNVIGANIYREDDKPLYRRGNLVLLGICTYNICLFVFAKYYYVRQNQQVWKQESLCGKLYLTTYVMNRKRERIWNSMSQAERETYLATTKDQGNRRLDFRFTH